MIVPFWRFGLLVAVICAIFVASPCRAADQQSRLGHAAESIEPDALGDTVDVLASPEYEGREAGSKGGWAAADYLVAQLKKLPLKPGGIVNESGASYFQTFHGNFRNIIAVLEGSDPSVRQNVILLGAHYDHLGHGHINPKSTEPPPIYFGADDNASGAAGVLQMARAFCLLPKAPKQTIVFIFFDGEEKGLLGSKHWVEHPTVPLANVKAMVNLDMIGGLRGEHLFVFGTRTSVGLRRFISQHNDADALNIEFSWQMRTDADHYTFYEHAIPAIFLHTGLHERYHRPTDVPAGVNRQGMAEVARLAFATVYDLANGSIEPQFRAASRSEDDVSRVRLEAYEKVAIKPGDKPLKLGLAWRSDDGEPGTAIVTGAVIDGPAAKAGIRSGDRIYQVNGREFKDDDEFMKLVIDANEKIELVIERAGVCKTFAVETEKRDMK